MEHILFKPISSYVNQCSDIVPDVETLKKEFNTIEPHLECPVNLNNIVCTKRLLLFEDFDGNLVFNENSVASNFPETIRLWDFFKSKLPSLNRAYWRIVVPCAAYNWHFDNGGWGVHIPLISDEGNLMVYNGKSFRFEVGSTYFVNSLIPHTFVNAGFLDRLHLCFENRHN